MSGTRSYYFKESHDFPVRLGTTDNLTSNANISNSQNINKVTVVRTVQGRKVNTTNSIKQGSTQSDVRQDHKQTSPIATSQQNVSKRIEDNDFVVTRSTFPTRIEKGQVSQVPEGLRESITEYKTVGNAFSNQRPSQVHTEINREYRVVNGDRILNSGSGIRKEVEIIKTTPYCSYKGLPSDIVNDAETFYYSKSGGEHKIVAGKTGRASNDSRDLSLGTQTGGSLRSQSFQVKDSSIGHVQEPVVQTVYVNVQGLPPADWETQTVKRSSTLTEQDIRLISAKREHGLRPVTLHNLRLDGTPAELTTKFELDNTYSLENQDVRLVPSNIERVHPVIVHNLHLDGTSADWKRLIVKPIEEERETEGSAVHTLQVDLQKSQYVDQRSTPHQTSEYQITREHSTSDAQDQEQEGIRTVGVGQLKQVFGQRQDSEHDKSWIESQKHINTADANTFSRGSYIIKTDSTPVESVIKRQETLVYQVQVSPHSPDRIFREKETSKRRDRRAVRRSSSNSAESYNMGNEQHKMAQADVTVEEDEGGNKMIVIEGKNIRVHSENYDTGKKGAKRVVLMPESARPGNKKFQMDTVNSYYSYDKRGQKEKMVVINGRLRESAYTGPEANVKVAKISTPTTVRKEISTTPEPQSSGQSTPVGKVTRVDVVKHQLSSSSEEKSVEDGKPLNIKHSILLFEKPQHAQQQRLHMGEKGIAQVQRLVKQNHHSPDMVKEVTIRPQQVVTERAEPGPVERKVLRVANSAHLARSLKGNEVILEKTPPPTRVLTKKVVTREGVQQHISKEHSVEESKHTTQLQSRSRQVPVRRDDDNVFNSHYYIRRENPLYAEIPSTIPRENRHLAVKQVGQKVEEEPHYATVNKVRKHANVQTEVKVKPIIHHDQIHKVEVKNQRSVGPDLVERGYGLTALFARETNTNIERKVVHDEVEGEISETKIVKTESVPVKVERHTKMEYNVPVPPDVALPKRERQLAHVIVEESITPERSRRNEGALNFSMLDSDNEKWQRTEIIRHAEKDSNVQRSGTASILTHSAHVDSTTAAYSKLTSSLGSLRPSEKHTTHWLIPDVSNRSEVNECETSVSNVTNSEAIERETIEACETAVSNVTYRTDITVGPKAGTDTIFADETVNQNAGTELSVAEEVKADIVLDANAKMRSASDSEVKCHTQNVYYINVKDDTPLEVNLEPANNVMDVGLGGIYIEDVHPNVESVLIRERSEKADDDEASVRTMYCTEIDLDKHLSCLLPGWRNEEEEDVLKNIDIADEDGGVDVVDSESVTDLQVNRGNILITNAMSTSNGPKFVDVVEDETVVEETTEAAEADDIANVFDNHFHVNRENPLYSSDTELNKEEESKNVRERFAPHNMYGQSEYRSRYGHINRQLTGETAHQSSYFDGESGFKTTFSSGEIGYGHGFSTGYTGSYLMGNHQRPRKVNTDVNGLVYAIPKAVFKSMSHFDGHRVGSGLQNSDGAFHVWWDLIRMV
jgi:hypothetical protein